MTTAVAAAVTMFPAFVHWNAASGHRVMQPPEVAVKLVGGVIVAIAAVPVICVSPAVGAMVDDDAIAVPIA